MHSIKKPPQFEQGRKANHGLSDRDLGAGGSVGHPHRYSTDTPVGKFATKVISLGPAHLADHSKCAAIEGMPFVPNGDFQRATGIM
jgi:hypothetical protein